jgi:PAS domain S-box-containing protein
MTLGDDRKETGKTSAESEELYRLLAENSTDMISKHTPEGVYTYASPACRNLLGYEPEELLGRSVYTFFHPEDSKRMGNAHSKSLERPDIYTVSYRIRRKSGSYIWFETTNRAVRDPETSEVLEIIGVSRDVTERKRIEEALRKSEEFHRLAVEAGRIGTWDLDLQTEECLISPKMAELMDFSVDRTTVPGARWRESIVPEDRNSMSSALAASIESDAPFDLEFRIALKDGTRRWLYSRGGVFRDASGKALRVHGASIDVTERKRAEEKVRKSEGRLRRAIEIETVGVIFFKTDGSITNANDAFLRMSGYSREDLAEGLVRWDEMTPPEWMPHSLKAIEEFESTGRTIPYEKEYVRKDGSRWWALFAATRLDEEEGVEFIIDITQSKRTEEELRKSGERITNILESITDAFVAVDRQWRFTYVNERASTTLQRTREELLGKNMWEEFPEAVGLPAYREYHRAMTSGASVHFEEFNPWLGIWVEITAYPSEGGLAVYFRDITERKRAEETLRESEERYRAVVEQSAEGLYLLDARTKRVIETNPSLQGMLGYSGEELKGMVLYDLIELPREEVDETLRRTLERAHRPVGERKYRRKDGGLVDVEIDASVIRYGGAEVVCALVRDVTERKRAEEALRGVREAERQRLARDLHDGVLQDLSYTAAAMGLMMIEAEDAGLREPLQGAIDAVRRAAKGLRDVVNDLRLGEEQDQSFTQLVESLVQRNRKMVLGCEISLEVEDGFPSAPLGEVGTEMFHIIQEALTNARRHSGARNVIVSLRVEEEELVAEVADDGHGFGAGTAPGLGLQTMRERSAALKGRLQIDSEVGEGTRVRLWVSPPQKG